MNFHGNWSPLSNNIHLRNGRISQFVAGVDSKSLSVTQIPEDHSTRMVLIYEDSIGAMTAVKGTAFAAEKIFFDWKWQNLTIKLQFSISPVKPRSKSSSVYFLDRLVVLFYENESNVHRIVNYSNDNFSVSEFSSTLSSI